MLAKTIYNVKGLHFQDVNITKKRGMWAFVNSAVQATVRSSIRKKKKTVEEGLFCTVVLCKTQTQA